MKKILFAFVGLAFLAACGGGGGGSTTPSAPGGNSGIVVSNPNPTPTPTSSSSTTVTGKAVDFTSGAPLVGFTVSVGALPSANACVQTATSNSCGVPVSPVTTTTAADGTFSIATTLQTPFMIMIAKDATYATFHRSVAASATSLGTIKITALSSDVQAWLADANLLRTTVSVPASYGNLVIDEYAEEQANTEAAAVAAGTQPYGDATEALFASNYISQPGAMYVAAGVSAIQPNPLAFATTYGGTQTLPAGAPGYQAADASWISGEKPACPSGNWSTCTFSGTTGHYINMSNTLDVWIGLGESSTAYPPSPSQYPYAGVIVQS